MTGPPTELHALAETLCYSAIDGTERPCAALATLRPPCEVTITA